MRVIIAAAGTGGHINPGIAIANKIKKNEPLTQDEIAFQSKFQKDIKDIEEDVVENAHAVIFSTTAEVISTVDSTRISGNLFINEPSFFCFAGYCLGGQYMFIK